LLKKKLNELEEDETVKQFLDKNFSEEKYRSLYNSVKAFVEGYDAADIEYASALHFKKEWVEVERWEAYRIAGGYGELINALKQKCEENGCFLYPSISVTQIKWRKNMATAVCEKGKVYTASKIIVTVPLSILQQDLITFFPPLPEKLNAARELKFGHVIKLQLLFKDRFWANDTVQQKTGRNTDNLFFLFSDEKIPTWWTQYPEKNSLLTGWLAGPRSDAFQSEEQLLNDALRSLASIFKTEMPWLKERMVSWRIFDWNKDPYSNGAYVYPTVNQGKYIETLQSTVEKTVYFAGEVFGTDSGVGLVESALESAYKVVQKIIIDA
jgi:monoamine oxidase